MLIKLGEGKLLQTITHAPVYNLVHTHAGRHARTQTDRQTEKSHIPSVALLRNVPPTYKFARHLKNKAQIQRFIQFFKDCAF